MADADLCQDGLKELQAQMPALGGSRADLLNVAHWAGDDEAARACASLGVARYGFARWCALYAADPELWLGELQGHRLLQSWRAQWCRLGATHRGLMAALSTSSVGLDATDALGSTTPPGDGSTLHALLASGWVEWRGARLRVAPMRQALVHTWFGAVPHDVILRYVRRRLERFTPPSWDSDSQACLAENFERVAAKLETTELLHAVDVLRRGRHAAKAMGALRTRLATAVHRDEERALRLKLGLLLMDMGAHGEALRCLPGRSRAVRVLRAHALLRQGQVRAGTAALRKIGPKAGDANWTLQWCLAGVLGGHGEAQEALRNQRLRAHDARAHAFAWTMDAEYAVRANPARAADGFERAAADFHEAGDVVGRAFTLAQLAQVQAARAKLDDAAHAARTAWSLCQTLPSAALRGSAALACVRAGVATAPMLEGALRAATHSDLNGLAQAAALALAPEALAPTLALGPSGALLDGVPLSLAAKGPTWRALRYLCVLPPHSVVDVEDLFRAGWPDERAHASSRRRRVQTAVWALRRAGLRETLETVGGDRYRLNAHVLETACGDE